MKLKGAAGYACYVSDLDKTVDFYQALGLEVKKREANRAIIYLNWYRIDLVTTSKDDEPELQKEAELTHKGAGVFLYFSVDDVDVTYQEVLAKGLKPTSEPKDQPWGNREFVLPDPDGYKLVIFKRKVAKNPVG